MIDITLVKSVAEVKDDYAREIVIELLVIDCLSKGPMTAAQLSSAMSEASDVIKLSVPNFDVYLWNADTSDCADFLETIGVIKQLNEYYTHNEETEPYKMYLEDELEEYLPGERSK